MNHTELLKVKHRKARKTQTDNTACTPTNWDYIKRHFKVMFDIWKKQNSLLYKGFSVVIFLRIISAQTVVIWEAAVVLQAGLVEIIADDSKRKSKSYRWALYFPQKAIESDSEILQSPQGFVSLYIIIRQKHGHHILKLPVSVSWIDLCSQWC